MLFTEPPLALRLMVYSPCAIFVVFKVTHKLVLMVVDNSELPLVSVSVAVAPAGNPETLKFTALLLLFEMVTRFVMMVELPELRGTVTLTWPALKRTVCWARAEGASRPRASRARATTANRNAGLRKFSDWWRQGSG